VKAHFLKHFTGRAERSIALAKSCQRLAAKHNAMAECMKASKSEMENDKDADPATFYANCALEFLGQSQAHIDDADACTEICKILSESRKAAGIADDLDAIVPTQISRVAPDAPSKAFRAIPRAGQPPIPVAAADSIFEKVYGDSVLGTDE
jgi:hypothetical protein